LRKAEDERQLLMQICYAEDMRILSGVVSKDHIHMHIEYPPKVSLAELVKRLKGRSSRSLQQEYPSLRKRYWAIGYGVWSTGKITDAVVQQYLEQHRNKSNEDNDSFIID
jgi:putative transposase